MFFWLETWMFQSDREGVVVSWSTKSTTMHLPKHCPYYNEKRAASKDGLVRLSKVPLLWNLLSLSPYFLVVFRTLRCSERRSIWSLLFSNLCSALLPRGLPPHGEAPFFGGEWQNDYQRNAFKSKGCFCALDQCELCSEKHSTVVFLTLQAFNHFVYLKS